MYCDDLDSEGLIAGQLAPSTVHSEKQSELNCLPRCQLFLDQLEAQVTEMGFQGHAHLPLATPLPLQSSGVLYVELQPQVYLMVAVAPGLMEHYHLLQVGR